MCDGFRHPACESQNRSQPVPACLTLKNMRAGLAVEIERSVDGFVSDSGMAAVEVCHHGRIATADSVLVLHEEGRASIE